jgi:hypothetical protein
MGSLAASVWKESLFVVITIRYVLVNQEICDAHLVRMHERDIKGITVSCLYIARDIRFTLSFVAGLLDL